MSPAVGTATIGLVPAVQPGQREAQALAALHVQLGGGEAGVVHDARASTPTPESAKVASSSDTLDGQPAMPTLPPQKMTPCLHVEMDGEDFERVVSAVPAGVGPVCVWPLGWPGAPVGAGGGLMLRGLVRR